MNECPHGKRYKPLPLRRGFWREYPAEFRKGLVLTPSSVAEGIDMATAAQAVLINHIESRLMRNFKRPTLAREGDFYAEFNKAYVRMAYAEEHRIWKEIGREVDQAFMLEPEREFTDKEAAYLTLWRLGVKKPPQSIELYMFLPAFAQAYEELLRKKYAERYTPAIFYKALRTHMAAFLLRIIGMDMVIIFLLTLNMVSTIPNAKGFILKPGVVLDSRLMGLKEDDKLFLSSAFVEAIHERAREQNFREDQSGRTEDRGCPVLYSSQRDAIIRFAIEELIAQHELYEHKT